MQEKKRLSDARWIMTLPDERYRSVLAAERLIQDLCDPKITPRVPKEIRQRARGVLRHYPSSWDMDRAATAAPDIFETKNPIEPLYRLCREYAEQQQRTGEWDPEVTQPHTDKD